MALAWSLLCKGASLPAAMVLEIAGTSLVVELGVILALMQFAWPSSSAGRS